MDLYSRSGL
uniref:3-isopropylmalate dehydratase large subunit 2 n=1 Tax=Arundo donax TaxID=35708 RepID=A0A0A9FBN0_ARUDO